MPAKKGKRLRPIILGYFVARNLVGDQTKDISNSVIEGIRGKISSEITSHYELNPKSVFGFLYDASRFGESKKHVSVCLWLFCQKKSHREEGRRIDNNSNRKEELQADRSLWSNHNILERLFR